MSHPLNENNKSSADMGEAPFCWPIRVYYEDADAGGVVYHGHYVRYLEHARTERLRSFGLELDALREHEDILFVVRSMQVDFLKPARFNDLLWVTAELEEARSSSLFFKQAVLRGGHDDYSEKNEKKEILCEARVRVVCLSAVAFRPKPVPAFIAQRLRGGPHPNPLPWQRGRGSLQE